MAATSLRQAAADHDRNHSGVKVTLVGEMEGLDSLRTRWNPLLKESGCDTVFLTWEWIRSWWESYASDGDLWVLSVEENGRLVGIAPFYRRTGRRYGLLRCRSLHLLGDGSGDSDYLDVIARRGSEERVVSAVLRFLLERRKDWDLLVLNEIPADSAILESLQSALIRQGFRREVEQVSCVLVPLPETWDDYLMMLKPRMRTKVRSLCRQLEEGYSVAFDECRRREDLAPRLQSLFDLHEQRWRMNDRTGVFQLSARRRFYEHMAGLFLDKGWLRFYSLSLDGEFVAHQFCFEYNRTLFLLQEAFDPRWTVQGVGNALRAYVFRDCIERRLAAYDFLGGVTSHKLSWGGEIKHSVRERAALRSVKTSLFLGVPILTKQLKEGLRSGLPEPILNAAIALKQRIFSGGSGPQARPSK